MSRFAVAVVYERGERCEHELYIVQARDVIHAEGIGLHHAKLDGCKLMSLLVTPTAAALVAA